MVLVLNKKIHYSYIQKLYIGYWYKIIKNYLIAIIGSDSIKSITLSKLKAQ